MQLPCNLYQLAQVLNIHAIIKSFYHLINYNSNINHLSLS